MQPLRDVLSRQARDKGLVQESGQGRTVQHPAHTMQSMCAIPREMTDSRLKSLTESMVNLVPGFGISYLSNLFILPHFSAGIAASDSFTMLQIGFWYTVISVMRSYLFRRLFERFGENTNAYSLLVSGSEKLRRYARR